MMVSNSGMEGRLGFILLRDFGKEDLYSKIRGRSVRCCSHLELKYLLWWRGEEQTELFGVREACPESGSAEGWSRALSNLDFSAAVSRALTKGAMIFFLVILVKLGDPSLPIMAPSRDWVWTADGKLSIRPSFTEKV